MIHSRHRETFRQAVLRAAAGMILVLALAACSRDRLLDTGVGFSYFVEDPDPAPDPSTAAAPVPTRRIAPENASWPSLARVPPRPRDALPASRRRNLRESLESERAESWEAWREIRTLEPPLTVPPRPRLKGPVTPPATVAPPTPASAPAPAPGSLGSGTP